MQSANSILYTNKNKKELYFLFLLVVKIIFQVYFLIFTKKKTKKNFGCLFFLGVFV